MAKPVKAAILDPKGKQVNSALTILNSTEASFMSTKNGKNLHGFSEQKCGTNETLQKSDNDTTEDTAVTNKYSIGNIWRPVAQNEIVLSSDETDETHVPLSTGKNKTKTYTQARLNLKRMVKSIKRTSAIENAKAKAAEKSDLAKYMEKVIGPHFTVFSRFIESKPLAALSVPPEDPLVIIGHFGPAEVPGRDDGSAGVQVIKPADGSETFTFSENVSIKVARVKFPDTLIRYAVVNGLAQRPEWAWVHRYVMIRPVVRGDTIPSLRDWAKDLKAEDSKPTATPVAEKPIKVEMDDLTESIPKKHSVESSPLRKIKWLITS